MTFVTGEVVPNPSGLLPYKVGFKHEGTCQANGRLNPSPKARRRSLRRFAVSSSQYRERCR